MRREAILVISAALVVIAGVVIASVTIAELDRQWKDSGAAILVVPIPAAGELQMNIWRPTPDLLVTLFWEDLHSGQNTRLARTTVPAWLLKVGLLGGSSGVGVGIFVVCIQQFAMRKRACVV